MIVKKSIKQQRSVIGVYFGIVAHTATGFFRNLVELKEHFEEIAEMLFFLLGAMTIVELIDIP